MAVNIQKLIDDMNNESKMRVVAKDFSMATKSYDIFLSGCTGACPGCHNTEAGTLTKGRIGRDICSRLMKILKILKMSLHVSLYLEENLWNRTTNTLCCL